MKGGFLEETHFNIGAKLFSRWLSPRPSSQCSQAAWMLLCQFTTSTASEAIWGYILMKTHENTKWRKAKQRNQAAWMLLCQFSTSIEAIWGYVHMKTPSGGRPNNATKQLGYFAVSASSPPRSLLHGSQVAAILLLNFDFLCTGVNFLCIGVDSNTKNILLYFFVMESNHDSTPYFFINSSFPPKEPCPSFLLISPGENPPRQ